LPPNTQNRSYLPLANCGERHTFLALGVVLLSQVLIIQSLKGDSQQPKSFFCLHYMKMDSHPMHGRNNAVD
jgi:hypothetical protein